MIVTPVPYKPVYWHINNGVFFANLGHPICRDILLRWKGFYDINYTNSDYESDEKWHARILCDQTSLQNILKNSKYEKFLYKEIAGTLFNGTNATVIKHYQRPPDRKSEAGYETLEERLKTISNQVESCLKDY